MIGLERLGEGKVQECSGLWSRFQNLTHGNAIDIIICIKNLRRFGGQTLIGGGITLPGPHVRSSGSYRSPTPDGRARGQARAARKAKMCLGFENVGNVHSENPAMILVNWGPPS